MLPNSPCALEHTLLEDIRMIYASSIFFQRRNHSIRFLRGWNKLINIRKFTAGRHMQLFLRFGYLFGSDIEETCVWLYKDELN